jgi:hypothetical protein
LFSHELKEVFYELWHLLGELNLSEVFETNLSTLECVMNIVTGESKFITGAVRIDFLLLYYWSARIEVRKRFIHWP